MAMKYPYTYRVDGGELRYGVSESTDVAVVLANLRDWHGIKGELTVRIRFEDAYEEAT